MFTGIIEEVGRVSAIERESGGARLGIACTRVLEDAAVGASIAVNGCCLTVIDIVDGSWTTDAQVETLDRTTLGDLAVGDRVNLERPVRLEDRLGGHLVQGHVDGVGVATARVDLPDGSARITITPPPTLMRYIVEKGSVTIDGVSLTVASCGDADFDVALIPHTLAVTTLGQLPVGGRVNLEADVFAKYAERLLVHSEVWS